MNIEKSILDYLNDNYLFESEDHLFYVYENLSDDELENIIEEMIDEGILSTIVRGAERLFRKDKRVKKPLKKWNHNRKVTFVTPEKPQKTYPHPISSPNVSLKSHGDIKRIRDRYKKPHSGKETALELIARKQTPKTFKDIKKIRNLDTREKQPFDDIRKKLTKV